MANILAKQAVAEFIGTFTLVFLGAGAIITNALLTDPTTGHSPVGLVGIALAHGLALVVMIQALGHISGGQFNPAVTLGLIVSRRMQIMPAAVYVGAQLLGGLVAGFTVLAIFNGITGGASAVDATHLGTPALGAGVSVGTAVLVETILTFFLVLVVHGIVDERQTTRAGGLIIGLTVAADILMGGPLTGAAMNPARWFGTAAANGYWDNAWVYWVGPLLGGALAGALYGYFLHDRPAVARKTD